MNVLSFGQFLNKTYSVFVFLCTLDRRCSDIFSSIRVSFLWATSKAILTSCTHCSSLCLQTTVLLKKTVVWSTIKVRTISQTINILSRFRKERNQFAFRLYLSPIGYYKTLRKTAQKWDWFKEFYLENTVVPHYSWLISWSE